MFLGFRRERNIRRVLRSLAGQRVSMIFQPGNIWVIECAPSNLPYQEEALSTCLMRGWVEILEAAVPKGELAPDGLPDVARSFKTTEPIYRVTDSGWSVINRTQTWLLATFAVSLLALVATTLQLWSR
jgi:hypothetical protein